MEQTRGERESIEQALRRQYTKDIQQSCAVTSCTYQYQPLDEDRNEIRLLTILPGDFVDAIRVSLEIMALDPDEPPDFEALSYAWGSQCDTQNIFVDSLHQTIKVTQNLDEALPYLRYQDRPRTMWIDAISVNQQDLVERSLQVKRMADIFSSASKVIVWLGPESSDSTLAIELCETVVSSIAVNWEHQNVSMLVDDKTWEERRRAISSNNAQLLALRSFLSRDWFQRLWIWQEVWLAKSVTIMCGDTSTTWTAVRAIVFLVYQDFTIDELRRATFVDGLIYRLYALCRQAKGSSIEQLIQYTRHSLCSDSRDRLFALRSLFREDQKILAIEPDYTKTSLEMQREFVRRYVNHMKRLNLLTAVEGHNRDSHWPSWLLNLSFPRLSYQLDSMKTSGDSEACFAWMDDETLRVTGSTVATVKSVEHFTLSNELATDTKLLRRLITALLGSSSTETYDDTTLIPLSICRTFIAKRSAEFWFPDNPDIPKLGECQRLLRKALLASEEFDQSASPLTAMGKKCYSEILARCYGRSIYMCEEGGFGLGSSAVRIGDKIVVFLGCTSAMILRPTGEERYEVIGETYHDEAVSGSAILGQLPEGIDFVRRTNDELNLGFDGFVNRNTGMWQVEDPRLSHVPLPRGWRRIQYKLEDYVTLYEYEETKNYTIFDPRMTPEELRKRGVQLEDFDLV